MASNQLMASSTETVIGYDLEIAPLKTNISAASHCFQFVLVAIQNVENAVCALLPKVDSATLPIQLFIKGQLSHWLIWFIRHTGMSYGMDTLCPLLTQRACMADSKHDLIVLHFLIFLSYINTTGDFRGNIAYY